MSWTFNPFTGTFDSRGSGGSAPSVKNFSYSYIPFGSSVTVSTGQEMYGSLPVEVDGTLTIDGAVTQEVDYSLWSFGWNIIPSTVSLRIKPERDLVFVSPLEIDGTLAIDGRLVEVD